MEKVTKKTNISWQLKEEIAKAVNACSDSLNMPIEAVAIEHPTAEEHGDYSTNVALQLAKQLGPHSAKASLGAKEIAEKIVGNLAQTIAENSQLSFVTRVEVAGAGFINFTLSRNWQAEQVQQVLAGKEKYGSGLLRLGEKIMVEFAHPNTHKQFHIGHLRNITIGESIIRILENAGAKVYRTNYQGDVGMHVAKALFGVLALSKEYAEAKKSDARGRVAFLGKAYVLGTSKFEEDETAKVEIVALNKKVYQKDPEIFDLWSETRKWSLDYFQLIYDRVYTKFDRLYFESEVAQRGKELVLANVGKVFQESDGAVIFPGEKFGLHNRVFVNSEGNPTYEGKDMGLGELQFQEFNPDLLIHNVGPEQTAYFEVVFEALAQLFPEFRGRELHNIYGWVKLKEGKMSSRTGNVVLGEWLLDEIKKRISEKYPDRVSDVEPIAIAAAKYSLLKVGSNQEIAFSIDESIALEGDSGPYLQYTFARARSVLRKAENVIPASEPESLANARSETSSEMPDQVRHDTFTQEELAILRWIYRFPEVVEQAARTYSPNLICSFLFELAKRFNNFYNNVPILPRHSGEELATTPESPNVPEKSDSGHGQNDELVVFRLNLVEATSIVIKNGLNLLGITALERM